MIQRIQSIFLFLAGASGLGVLAFPFANTAQAVSGSALFADANYSTSDNIALLILFAVAGALAIASIFLFKNRLTQMRVAQLAIVANVIGIVLTVVLLWQDGILTMKEVEPNDGVSAYLPIAFIIFGILALRNINKDEKLVKSMDRLR